MNHMTFQGATLYPPYLPLQSFINQGPKPPSEHTHPPTQRPTCAEDTVSAKLLGKRYHVGFSVGVELPTGDTNMEPQPWGVALTAAVPIGGVIVDARVCRSC